MARVLFGSYPLWGHINPTVAIAQRLQEHGHTVAYACHPEMAEALGRAGLKLLQGSFCTEEFVRFQRELGVTKKKWLTLLRGGGGSILTLYVDGLEEAVEKLVELIRAWKPDVIVNDALFPAGAIAADICGLPYCTSCPAVLPLPSKALPPYGGGFPLKSSPTWKWPLVRMARNIFADATGRVINRVRAKYNLPPIHSGILHPSPYLYLAYTTEAFEYERPDLPPQVYLVGPSVSKNRGDAADVEFPWEWLDRKPTVYASLGTVNTGRVDFFNKVIEASRNQPWKTVLSVGRCNDLSKWRGIPDNVLIKNYIPQTELLKRVHAVISHGGNNTVTETLAAGIPLAVLPTGSDQYESAQRVVEAGVGFRLDIHRVTVEEIRCSMRRLIEDVSFGKNARRIAEDFKKCDGPGVSAALIIKLAETKAPLLRKADGKATTYANEAEGILRY